MNGHREPELFDSNDPAADPAYVRWTAERDAEYLAHLEQRWAEEDSMADDDAPSRAPRLDHESLGVL